MGHGASTSKPLRSSVIASQDLIDGSSYLYGDVQFRAIFISFVKSGEWAEQLPQLFKDDQSTGCLLCKYQFATGPHVCGLDGLCSVPISNKFVSEKKTLSNREISIKKSFHQQPSNIRLPDSCITVGDCSCFTAAQFMALLMGILYPMFASMPESESEDVTARLFRSIRIGSPSTTTKEFSTVRSQGHDDTENLIINTTVLAGTAEAPSSPGAASTATALVGATAGTAAPSKPKPRPHTLLLACAELFDEASLLEELAKKTWVNTIAETFELFPVALTISNTSRAGWPFVYCNAAFETLSGYTRQEAAGSSMDFLSGGATEPTQFVLMQEAMRTARPVDVAITHYHKKKRAYVSLVSIKPSGKHCVAAHFPVTKGMRSEDLKVIFFVHGCCMLYVDSAQ